ncbi:MAG TPA: hypothetical protein VG122_01645 [Gemmata sp.]|nr:hypothetical protein [Gemmata sp.]
MLTAIESRRLNRGLSGHSPIASVSVTIALGSAGAEPARSTPAEARLNPGRRGRLRRRSL